MFGRKKKRQQKGWAMDKHETGRIGIRERLGSNNKLWILLLIAVICVSTAIIAMSVNTPETIKGGKLAEDPIGHYLDADHRAFELDIVKMAKNRGEKAEAKFLSDRTFKLVLPCDISGDELLFLSRSTAMGIWRKFSISPVVWTYTEDLNNSNPKLTARTEWSEDAGDFRVKLDQGQ